VNRAGHENEIQIPCNCLSLAINWIDNYKKWTLWKVSYNCKKTSSKPVKEIGGVGIRTFKKIIGSVLGVAHTRFILVKGREPKQSWVYIKMIKRDPTCCWAWAHHLRWLGFVNSNLYVHWCGTKQKEILLTKQSHILPLSLSLSLSLYIYI